MRDLSVHRDEFRQTQVLSRRPDTRHRYGSYVVDLQILKLLITQAQTRGGKAGRLLPVGQRHGVVSVGGNLGRCSGPQVGRSPLNGDLTMLGKNL
jgi:hypothetical protein